MINKGGKEKSTAKSKSLPNEGNNSIANENQWSNQI